MANGNAAAALGLEAVAARKRYTRAPARLKGIRRSVARFGRIDRSIQDVSSRPDMLCTFVTLDS
jgi:hypothetical protein